MRWPTHWAVVLALNLTLAAAAAALAPTQLGVTADRLGYEYVGQHGLASDCPHAIFCYRVLVPLVLEPWPLTPEVRWRLFAVLANAGAGFVVARLTARASPQPSAPILATVLAQTSFGFTFAIFDPFTPDPAVFLASALLGMAWLADRPVVALLIAGVSVFAKETVVLAASAVGVAAAFVRPPGWRVWAGMAALSWALVLGFHLLMDRLLGWSEAGSGSADLLGGSWLGRWLTDPTLTVQARLFYAFIPFGFGWLFAVLGTRRAPDRLRGLAAGYLIVLPGLVYVQTVERALATAAFVVVPLAALFLAEVPTPFGLAAAIANGLLTSRVGLSTGWLPSVPILFALAAVAAAATAYPVLLAALRPSVPADRTAPSE
jgi:hypothetical protein